jgi:hypothetical protein
MYEIVKSLEATKVESSAIMHIERLLLMHWLTSTAISNGIKYCYSRDEPTINYVQSFAASRARKELKLCYG